MGREIVKEEDAWDISFLFEMMWPTKDLSDPPQEDCLVPTLTLERVDCMHATLTLEGTGDPIQDLKNQRYQRYVVENDLRSIFLLLVDSHDICA
jgi:hypothetical protein